MAVRLMPSIVVALVATISAQAQILSHPPPHLNFVYPAGGQQGQTLTVELGAVGGLGGATGVLIEGPSGVAVGQVKSIDASRVQTTITISADAVPGRRWLRVVGGENGLTNARPFFVGKLAEQSEIEPNNSPPRPRQS